MIGFKLLRSFQGLQGFAGRAGNVGPPGPAGPPGQAVSLDAFSVYYVKMLFKKSSKFESEKGNEHKQTSDEL